MAALAPAGTPTPLRLTARFRAPLLMTLTTLISSPTRPACFNARTSTSAKPSRSSIVSDTSALKRSDCDLNPTLWYPRAQILSPWWRRLGVLPRPEPMPRPTRRLACLAPAAGLMLLSCIVGLSEYLDQVADLVDHAAHRRTVLQFADAVQLAQTQTTHGGAMGFLAADGAAHELDFDGLLGSHVCNSRSGEEFFNALAALGCH